jgi:hypothetical protein
LRRPDNFLTKKIQVLFYLVEVRSAYYHRFINNEAVQLLHLANAITDGDSAVWFRKSDVIVTGVNGCSLELCGNAWIFARMLFGSETTRPKAVYLKSKNGSALPEMKNSELLVSWSDRAMPAPPRSIPRTGRPPPFAAIGRDSPGRNRREPIESNPKPVGSEPDSVTCRPDLIPSMAMAAVAAKADGVHIEVHDCPEKALSDGPQALLPEQYAAVMVDLRKLAEVLGRTIDN